MRTILKGIVAYSVEVTTLGSSTLSGPERCGELAEFLDEMTRPVLLEYPAVFNATTEDLDTLLMDIRAQENLLQGLNKAQPWVEELARVADMVFDHVGDSLDEIALYLESRIDSANADFVRYHELVQQLRNNTFQGLVCMGDYRRGDDTALAKSDQKLTLEKIQGIEERLLMKPQTAREFKEQLAPDKENYRNQQRELDDLYANAIKQLRKSRITVIVWSRTHRDLARGIVEPAMVNIFDLTKKAVDTTL